MAKTKVGSKRGPGWHKRSSARGRKEKERKARFDSLTPTEQAWERYRWDAGGTGYPWEKSSRKEKMTNADWQRINNAYEYLGERQSYKHTGAMDMPTTEDYGRMKLEGLLHPAGKWKKSVAVPYAPNLRPRVVGRGNRLDDQPVKFINPQKRGGSVKRKRGSSVSRKRGGKIMIGYKAGGKV